jgi:inner membrane protein
MDPLSHVLLGAASGHALARSHRKAAALAGATGALLPDADVFIPSGSDPLLTLEYHRHFSHALALSPIVALLAAGLAWLLFRRRAPYTVLYGAGLAGVVSAILLDACTSYGVHLLWPFREERYAWSIVAVVDPVMTLILLTGLVLAMRADSARRARITVLCATAYLGLGWIQQQRAEALIAQTASARGHPVIRTEVKPTLGNLVLWRSIYQHGNDYVVDAVRAGIFSGPRVYPGAAVAALGPGQLRPPLPPGSVQARDVERFRRESDGFLVRHPDRPDVIGDVRYAMLPDSVRPLWGIRLDPAQPDRHVEFLAMREFTRADRERFVAMLLGRPPLP